MSWKHAAMVIDYSGNAGFGDWRSYTTPWDATFLFHRAAGSRRLLHTEVILEIFADCLAPAPLSAGTLTTCTAIKCADFVATRYLASHDVGINTFCSASA